MSNGKTIAKNASVMMASQLITWVMAIVMAVFVPRYLGAMAMGQIAVANSIWLMMGVLFAFGMDTYLTKSIAREPKSFAEMLGTSLLIRTVFYFIGCLVVAFYVNLMGYDAQQITVITIIGVAYIFHAYVNGLVAALNGLEHMGQVSLATIAGKVVLTGVTMLVILLGFKVYEVAAVNILSAIVIFAMLFFIANKIYPIRLRLSTSAAIGMLRASSPYLLSGLAMVAYQQVDKLFIAALVDARNVGWYSTAMNLFGTMMFIPVVFGTVIFPTMARSYGAGQDRLNSVAQRSINLMFILSVPIGLGIVVIAEPLVMLFYGIDFLPAGQVLMILGIVLIFTYLNTLLGQLLVSTDRTGKWNVVLIAAVVLTLPLDLLLVPWMARVYNNGALGAVLGFLVTEFFMLVSAVLLLPKGTIQWSNVRTFALALLSGVLMMGAGWWARDIHLLLTIAVCGLVYPGAILLLRVIAPEDMLILRASLDQLIGRIRRNKGASASIGN